MKVFFDNESRFLEAVKKGEVENAKDKLSTIFKEFKGMNCNNILLYSGHLINSLRSLVLELNKFRQEPINAAKLLPDSLVEETETLDELLERILKVLSMVERNEIEGHNEKYRVLAEKIKDIIDAGYADSNLNASQIAGILKITSTHTGRVFNEFFNMSIPEYISSIRMSKAVEWLENSKLSIKDVMLKVGIENERNFYKLFKSKFGTTPREYAQRRDDIG